MRLLIFSVSVILLLSRIKAISVKIERLSAFTFKAVTDAPLGKRKYYWSCIKDDFSSCGNLFKKSVGSILEIKAVKKSSGQIQVRVGHIDREKIQTLGFALYDLTSTDSVRAPPPGPGSGPPPPPGPGSGPPPPPGPGSGSGDSAPSTGNSTNTDPSNSSTGSTGSDSSGSDSSKSADSEGAHWYQIIVPIVCGSFFLCAGFLLIAFIALVFVSIFQTKKPSEGKNKGEKYAIPEINLQETPEHVPFPARHPQPSKPIYQHHENRERRC